MRITVTSLLLFLSLIILSFNVFLLIPAYSTSSFHRNTLFIDLNQPRGNWSASKTFSVIIHAESNESISLRGLNVTVYRDNGTVLASGLTNTTGFVMFQLPEGVFRAVVSKDFRVIGSSIINVTRNELFNVPLWVYNLTIRCLDLKGRTLKDHIVYIYDQVFFFSWNNFTVCKNETGVLVGWNKTDADGEVSFRGLYNGTYLLKVVSGRVIYEDFVDLQECKSVVAVCNKTDLILQFVSSSTSSKVGDPIPNVKVNVYDGDGNSVFKDYTNGTGHVFYSGVYSGRYSVFAEWEGMEIWSGIIDVSGDIIVIKCPVYRLTVKVLDPSGNPIPNADVTISRVIRRYRTFITRVIKTGKTDRFGYYTCLLPQSRYEISCSYGIYRGISVLDLNANLNVEVMCLTNAGVWFSAIIVPLPLLFLTFILERRKLKKPLEMKRYRSMLEKLENLYENGLIEYRLYRKLREEYEAKLMELGGREL
ncbi:carboxypeptidase regulatory-like domain-containing protein, partial [Candidatus Bathyarchaeota archaeon]